MGSANRLAMRGRRFLRGLRLPLILAAVILPAAGAWYFFRNQSLNRSAVVEFVPAGAPSPVDEACPEPESCSVYYERFLEKAAPFARPISEDELQALFQGMIDHRTRQVDGPMPAPELRAKIIDALNMGFLLDGFDRRRLTVEVLDTRTEVEYTQQLLRLTDEWVGRFDATLRLPPNDGPHKALIGADGHSSIPHDFLEQFFGDEYPARNYAIVVPQFRADNADGVESELTHAMLRAGFSLNAVRVYEILLMFKYLRSRPDIEADHIGLIGHSGGAGNGALAVRIEPRFRAFISDHLYPYDALPRPEYFDAVNPYLYPYGALINDFSTSSVPVLQVAYQYPEGPGVVFDFLAEHL